MRSYSCTVLSVSVGLLDCVAGFFQWCFTKCMVTIHAHRNFKGQVPKSAVRRSDLAKIEERWSGDLTNIRSGMHISPANRQEIFYVFQKSSLPADERLIGFFNPKKDESKWTEWILTVLLCIEGKFVGVWWWCRGCDVRRRIHRNERTFPARCRAWKATGTVVRLMLIHLRVVSFRQLSSPIAS